MEIARDDYTDSILVGHIHAHLVLPDNLTLNHHTIRWIQDIPLRLNMVDETSCKAPLLHGAYTARKHPYRPGQNKAVARAAPFKTSL